MQTRTFAKSKGSRGSTLLVVMGTVIVLGIILAAVLKLVSHENRIMARASAWNAALPMAEAGIEEALSHLCRVDLKSRATNGWQATGSTFVNNRTLTDGRYAVGITSSRDAVILSVGQVWCPSAAQYIERRIQVTTRWAPVIPGLVSKTKAEVQTSGYADSYDSGNSLYSTGGRYDPAKYRDKSVVGCILGNVIVKDSAKVYGLVGTDTGSITVSSPGKVGDKAWVNGASTGLQAGHSTSDLEMDFPNVTVPALTWITSIPASKILSNANYKVLDYTLDSGTLRVKGNVTLYVEQTIYFNAGQLVIDPGGRLDLYFGSQFYAQGTSKINTNGTPDQLTVIGVGTNAKEVYLQDTTYLTGTIYAPYAKMYVQGDSQFSGAGACDDLVLQGLAKFHYDEMLGKTAQPYRITSWNEL